MSSAALSPGLADTVHDAQLVFRAAMTALARPGSLHRLAGLPTAPRPLSPAAAALALTLADHETPLWLDAPLAACADVASYLRFHTGARIVATAEEATFALIGAPAELPVFDTFAQGTLAYPDRSATLIVQLDRLHDAAGWTVSGPGIAGTRSLSAAPLPEDFPARMAANRALFPRGIDLLLTAGDAVAALARTTILKA